VTKVYFLDDAGVVLYLGLAGEFAFAPEAAANAVPLRDLPEGHEGHIEIELTPDAHRRLIELFKPAEVIVPSNPNRQWERANDWRNKRRKFGA
jgi:hypothetical protein